MPFQLFFGNSQPSYSLVGDSLASDSLVADSLASDSLATDSLSRDSLSRDSVSHGLSAKWLLSEQEPVGVMSEPAPYNSGSDGLVSVLVFVGLVAAILSLAVSQNFIGRQIKNFFYLENDRTTSVPDTASEIGGQIVLVLFCCILIAVGCYHLSTLGYDNMLWEVPTSALLGLYLVVVVGYFSFKALLYQFVNWVFFDVKKIEQWNKSQLFVTAMLGLAFAPILLLMVYGNVSPQIMLIVALVVAVLAKILTFYKCYLIFFGRIGAFLQIFLYFCALELVPLMGFAAMAVALNNNLKINF